MTAPRCSQGVDAHKASFQKCRRAYCLWVTTPWQFVNTRLVAHTGLRRLIESPKLQIIFHKRATKYRALLLKMTCKDKGSYESSPPCTASFQKRRRAYCLWVTTRRQFVNARLVAHTASFTRRRRAYCLSLTTPRLHTMRRLVALEASLTRAVGWL